MIEPQEPLFKAHKGRFLIVAQDKTTGKSREVAEPPQLTLAQQEIHALRQAGIKGTTYTLYDDQGKEVKV